MCIKSYISKILLPLCSLFSFHEIKAQVILQDSLALVALYNAQPLMGDSTWFQGNVSTWTGVTVEGNRVTRFQVFGKSMYAPIPQEICGLDTLAVLTLQANYLTGSIPACIIDMPYLTDLNLGSNILSSVEVGTDFSHMNAIRHIGLSYNYFTEMPDFASITSSEFTTLNVEYNYFNFDDLLPLLDRIDTTYYMYYPQNMGYSTTFVVNDGAVVDFPSAALMAGGTGNSYNWYAKDVNTNAIHPIPSTRFSNINGPVLHIEGALLSDKAYYQCDVTNPRLPHLVWQTGYLGLFINPLATQTIYYMGDTITSCGDPLLLSAATSSGNPVSLESLNNDIATVNSDNTLNVHQPGIATIRATAPRDAFYYADTLLVNITVTSNVILPVLQITEQLPIGEGEDLGLSVPYYPQLTYEWTTPNGQHYDSSVLVVSPFTSSDLGTYTVRLMEGSCLRSALSVAVNDLVYGKPVIYQLITPNGDGDNETFYIKNLNPAVYNEVSVFNASHQIVFHEENYRNNWSGDHLPVGTYYYIVRVGENTYKGNLYIKR